MPIKNTATTVEIIAWNTNTQSGQVGDSANITVRGVGDGVEFTPSAPTITEKDATYLKGIYSVSLIPAENNYDQATIGGISTSTNVVIIPFSWANEQIDFNTTQKASINTEADTALSDYDPPTRAELTTDKNSIIAEIDANEAKIDIIDTNIDALTPNLEFNTHYPNG